MKRTNSHRITLSASVRNTDSFITDKSLRRIRDMAINQPFTADYLLKGWRDLLEHEYRRSKCINKFILAKHRPESCGGLVRCIRSYGGTPDALLACDIAQALGLENDFADEIDAYVLANPLPDSATKYTWAS